MHGGFYSTLRPGDSSEAATWFDKYNCVLLVLCEETYCAMGDLGSSRADPKRSEERRVGKEC